ncbi:MAG: S1 RNA-binding domain-containing protein [Candidatus Woesearchaeota archaeon]|nr:MAG: S1 RNA-binding domain-containing protein [Candidatus Woesearchaeota archaeon]
MFYKKKNFPDEGELVICIVKRILPNSVFVDLEGYENKEGLIHISEVSPGRIRNLRDFVKEGKKIVCKVLRVDKLKGHIDLSLRRVSSQLGRNKINEVKQEEKAEKILEIIGKGINSSLEDIYKNVGLKAIENYGSLTNFFQAIANDDQNIKNLKIEDKCLKEIIKIVKQRIKPPEIKLSLTLVLKNNTEEGIERIKSNLKNLRAFAEKNNYTIKIIYLGAPKYKLEITAKEFKAAEKIIKDLSDKITQEVKQNKGELQILRDVK